MVKKLPLLLLAALALLLFALAARVLAGGGHTLSAEAHVGHCGDTLPGGEIWPPGVHTITCDVVVAAGSTLTIQPGAIVKFHIGTHLVLGVGAAVNSLDATGAIFTSIRDDSVGGDSNGDGVCGVDVTAACPAAGNWGSIFIATCCGNPASINIASSEVHYGGGGEPAPVAAQFGGQISLTDSRVTMNSGNGVYMGHGSIPNFSGNTIDSDGGGSNVHGLALTDAWVGTLSGNSFDNNPGCAVLINNPQGLINPQGNTRLGNGWNGVCLSGNFASSTLSSANSTTMPYVIGIGSNVSSGATVQFSSGSIVKFETGASLDVGVGADPSTLSASGATFTSVRDDSVGGDTKGDGVCGVDPGATCPAPGDWGAITISTCCGNAATINIASSTILYGGGGAFAPLQKPGLTGQMSLSNSQISTNANSGLYLKGGGLTLLSGNTFTGNQICAVLLENPVGTVNPVGNTASGNAFNGVCLTGSFGSTTLKPTNAFALPYVIEGASPTIPPGTNVVIEPGAVVKFDISARLTVDGGNLTAGGGGPEFTVFTSVRDDRYTTNTDGAAIAPTRGDWFFIRSANGGVATFSFAKMFYGGRIGVGENFGMAACTGCSALSIEHAALEESASSGAYFDSSDCNTASCRVVLSKIIGMNGYGVRNASNGTIVDARNNWWNASSGPSSDLQPCNTATGTGELVSCYVLFTPWLTGDDDGDGFSSRSEINIGTDPLARCPASPSHNAWPADINNDGFSDISDIDPVNGSFGLPVPPTPARHNIAPDPPDGFVDISDIDRLNGFFGLPCNP